LKRPYESIVIFDGTLSDDTIIGESKKIEEFLAKNAAFESTAVWGKRHMAYIIKKKKTGVYHLFNYTGEGDIAGKLDKFLKLNEAVLRHITVARVDRQAKADVVAPSSEERA